MLQTWASIRWMVKARSFALGSGFLYSAVKTGMAGMSFRRL